MSELEKTIVAELIEAARANNNTLVAILLFRMELAAEAAERAPH